MIRKVGVKALLAVCCGLFAVAVLCNPQSGWTSSHVISGGKDLNGVHFSDSKRGWVCGDRGFLLSAGSIFETSDGGHSWQEAHKFSAGEFAGATPELYSLRFNGKKRG